MKQKTTVTLLIGDLLIVLLFSAIGRVSHHMVPDPLSVLKHRLSLRRRLVGGGGADRRL